MCGLKSFAPAGPGYGTGEFDDVLERHDVANLLERLGAADPAVER